MAEADVLRTEAADGSQLKIPGLVAYNAMRQWRRRFILGNGTHTDTIFDSFQAGACFVDGPIAERHEPDAPSFTPRIARCLALPEGGAMMWLCVIGASRFDVAHSGHRFFRYADMAPGYGFCVTTYQGDGDPLPPFEGVPLLMPLAGSVDEIGSAYWRALHRDNRVSLAVKRIAPDASSSDITVIDQYGQG